MAILRIFVICLFIFLAANYAFPQVEPLPCLLSLQDAPTLRGLSLGMTSEEVSKSLGVSIDLKDRESSGVHLYKDSKSGEFKTTGRMINIGEKEWSVFVKKDLIKQNKNFEGIEIIDGKFFEDRLFSFSIIYDPSTYRFKTIRPLTSSLAAIYDLPERSWDYSDGGAYMKCRGFTIIASKTIVDAVDLEKMKDPSKKFKTVPLIKRTLIFVELEDTFIAKRISEKAEAAVKEEYELEKREKARKIFKP